MFKTQHVHQVFFSMCTCMRMTSWLTASCMYPVVGMWFVGLNAQLVSELQPQFVGWFADWCETNERLLKARDLGRLMRSRTWRREMEWESRAPEVAACIKFSQWEAVVGCFIWKQWSRSKWGSGLMGEPPVINNVSGWCGPGWSRHLKRKEQPCPMGSVNPLGSKSYTPFC